MDKKEKDVLELKPIKLADEIVEKPKVRKKRETNEKKTKEQKLEKEKKENSKVKKTKSEKEIKAKNTNKKIVTTRKTRRSVFFEEDLELLPEYDNLEYDEYLDESMDISADELKKGYGVVGKRFKLNNNIIMKLIALTLKELLIPVVLLTIFVMSYILKGLFNHNVMNIFVVGLVITSIVFYEKSYRNSNESLFIRGIEINAMTYVYILFANKLIQGIQKIEDTLMYILIFGIYYLLKCIIIYIIEKQKYIKSVVSAKELTKDNRRRYI